MATFILLVSFTDQGIRAAQDSPKRADTFKALAKKAGVNVKDVYWTLGHYDIVAICCSPKIPARVLASMPYKHASATDCE